jgi:hypothetical protein
MIEQWEEASLLLAQTAKVAVRVEAPSGEASPTRHHVEAGMVETAAANRVAVAMEGRVGRRATLE